MKGRLSPRCPADILSEIQRRQVSGTLSLSHAGVTRQLFIDQGLAILFAASNQPAESFTAQLSEKVRLTAVQVRAATEGKRADELLGTTLVRLGFVPAAQMAAVTREHIHRVALAALAMGEGEWQFHLGALPLRDRLDTGLRIAELVLEWSRGLKDAAWIRQRLGSDATRIQRERRPPEGYQSIRLDAAEGYIMSRVDGAATVGEIGMMSPMGEERTLAALIGLALAGILEMPGAGALPPVIEIPRAEEEVAPQAAPEDADAADVPAASAAAPPAPAVPEAGAAPQAAAPVSPAAAAAAGQPATGTSAPPAGAPGKPPLRLVSPPAGSAKPGQTAPGKTAPPRVGAGAARPAAGARPRLGERRKLTPVRRPPAPVVPKPTPLPDEAQVEMEMGQRFDQIHALDLYQVLGVSPSAAVDEVRRAYYALARRFHPDRFRNEQIKPRAEKVFGRITEAYATLSDQETRRRYDEEEKGKAERADSRPADTSDLARQNFRSARENLEHGHFDKALGFLQNACQQDPTKAEYFALLGLTQSKNPRLRKDAEASLLKAIELDPASASAYANLGALYERVGAIERAHAMYRKALQWDPENAIARQGLEREEPGRKGILGLFSRKS
jgi:DnaJ-domain-containing protein 1